MPGCSISEHPGTNPLGCSNKWVLVCPDLDPFFMFSLFIYIVFCPKSYCNLICDMEWPERVFLGFLGEGETVSSWIVTKSRSY